MIIVKMKKIFVGLSVVPSVTAAASDNKYEKCMNVCKKDSSCGKAYIKCTNGCERSKKKQLCNNMCYNAYKKCENDHYKDCVLNCMVKTTLETTYGMSRDFFNENYVYVGKVSTAELCGWSGIACLERISALIPIAWIPKKVVCEAAGTICGAEFLLNQYGKICGSRNTVINIYVLKNPEKKTLPLVKMPPLVVGLPGCR